VCPAREAVVVAFPLPPTETDIVTEPSVVVAAGVEVMVGEAVAIVVTFSVIVSIFKDKFHSCEVLTAVAFSDAGTTTEAATQVSLASPTYPGRQQKYFGITLLQINTVSAGASTSPQFPTRVCTNREEINCGTTITGYNCVSNTQRLASHQLNTY